MVQTQCQNGPMSIDPRKPISSQDVPQNTDLPAKIQRLEAFFRDVGQLIPEIARLQNESSPSLTKKEQKTLEHIIHLIDQTSLLRAKYLKIVHHWDQIHKNNQPDESDSKVSFAASEVGSPAARLEKLRKAIEFKYAMAIPAELSQRVREWEENVKESCACALLDEIEGTIRSLKQQKKEWEQKCHIAEFGNPGFFARFRVFKLYLKHKSLEQQIARDRLKLNSVRSATQKHMRTTELLAHAVMCHYKIFDSNSSPMMKFFDKILRLECEAEIGTGIRRRGQSLVTKVKEERAVNFQKSRYTADAVAYIRSRTLFLRDLRRTFSEQKRVSAAGYEERLLHSCFVLNSQPLALILQESRKRLQLLEEEYELQRQSLLKLAAPLNKALCLNSVDHQNEGTRGEAFVVSAAKNGRWI